MPFVHLQIKSAYSLLSSSVKLQQLVERAKELNVKALALTDEHTMYGCIAFYKQCLKHQIKPIIGLTASVIYKDVSRPLVLLASSNAGYRNLVKISSILQTKSPEGLPHKWMRSYSEGLIALTPGIGGYIEEKLLNGEEEEALEAAREYKDIFGEEHFYLSVQKIRDDETESRVNEGIKKLAGAAGVSMAATNSVHYLKKEDAFSHKCLLAIKNNEKLSEMEEDAFPVHEYYLKSPQEMAEAFEDSPDCLENTLKIADMCNVDLQLGKTRLPRYPAPEAMGADEYLERLCLEGMKQKVKELDDHYFERLTFELDVIKEMNYSDYFLIVWDFMDYARRNGILTGPGRGSAAGSLVAFSLGITQVDPIQHRLLFERFLNPERISMPDIDIDFPDNRRDEVIAYVAEKYGKLHVAQIITFGTLAARAALRDIGRVMGVSAKEAEQLAKFIPSRPGTTLEKVYSESAQLQDFLKQSESAKRIYQTAMKIEGLPRHASTHAAGVVLSDQPLTDIIPIQEGHNGVYLTQFSMDYLEDLGLLKMDFLGLRNLTLIDSIIKMIRRETGRTLSADQLPYEDDEKTFSLLSEGNTTGIFQLESEGMRSVLRRLGPTSLEDITAVNALYRPGPMENIPLFIDRKHGRKEVHYPHADLAPILMNTYGVIVYQEQIMEIASKLAGFTLAEADILRRAVSKKEKTVLDMERKRFVSGCIQKGYTEETGNRVYDLIVKFANYGFNRSHAVAYSMIACQLAYLKAHYPLFFMAALLTSVSGNEDKVSQYIREARQSGIEVLPPSINSSEYPFLVEQEGIRYSLAAIKNVGISAVKDIFEARRQKLFEDLFDFCIRVSSRSVNRRTLECLILSGAFDEFGMGRASLLASLDIALEHAELLKPADGDQIDFFKDEEFMLKPKYVEVENFGLEEKLRFEKEALGLYFSSHPAERHRSRFLRAGAVEIAEVHKMHSGKHLKLGAFITKVRTIRTKKGDSMAFLAISDESGDMEAVAFPSAFGRLATLLQQGEVVLLEGKLDIRDEREQFIIEKAQLPEKLAGDEGTLFLKASEEVQQSGKLSEVKRILKKYSGRVAVYLYYENSKKTIQLPSEFHIQPSQACLEELKGLLGSDHVVLKENMEQ
ncbi:DNA polymerase III subunit alpha [Bacillus lacus]|uniref:DNA polymerase III subunit alpha n=1 Tax=Metabacillus lacus TaxID=1983721 RepID=A0A7X2IY04_9BACI|nr:DNA polymerase III subunit alpha [Metabacillus lacus]MRX71744.1 DNA polymerase III subunit alpha [Metabacillus lacus]